MSETQAKPLPPDFPVIDTPETRVNMRKALAGIYLLRGEGSQLKCLVKAGYSRATARIQTQAGLSAKACIAEAAKLDSRANPAKMLEVGRSRAMLAIESCDPTTVPLKDAMKMLDTVEKYYGGHQLQPSSGGLALAERLAGIAALLAVARERGLPIQQAQLPAIEAQLVATSPTQGQADNVSVSVTDSKG